MTILPGWDIIWQWVRDRFDETEFACFSGIAVMLTIGAVALWWVIAEDQQNRRARQAIEDSAVNRYVVIDALEVDLIGPKNGGELTTKRIAFCTDLETGETFHYIATWRIEGEDVGRKHVITTKQFPDTGPPTIVDIEHVDKDRVWYRDGELVHLGE